MAKNLMIQGTMSNAGKSIITAGILRVLKQDGFLAAPFKSQNMALNSFITKQGLEMGRAQVMQAEAAGIEPTVEMNPILLKPTSDVGSQVIVNGEVLGNMRAKEYFAYKKSLIPDILKAYKSLDEKYDCIVLEGAGSPAEINLKSDDIVNMGMARLVDAPVLLVGDIDRGGVFAQLVGTIMLLEKEERKRVKGLVINKFRGDKTILEPGIRMLSDKCKIPITGVIPYVSLDIDDEDSLSERFCKKEKTGLLDIVVIRLPHISNFTDFNPLEGIEEVALRYVSHVSQLKNPDLILLPGTKNTMEDLRWLRESGMEAAIKKLVADNCLIFGICGGYQMMGESLSDPKGLEGGGNMAGMGLLPVKTVFESAKTRTRVIGQVEGGLGNFGKLAGASFQGYEIHMGNSCHTGGMGKEFSRILPVLGDKNHSLKNENKNGNLDGCIEKNAAGTYVHGIFDEEQFLNCFLHMLYEKKGLDYISEKRISREEYKNRQYDLLADVIREHMDMKQVYRIMGL